MRNSTKSVDMVIEPANDCLSSFKKYHNVIQLLVILLLGQIMTKPMMTCLPSNDSDQPEHPTSVIRLFAVCVKKLQSLGYPLNVCTVKIVSKYDQGIPQSQTADKPVAS